MNYSLGKKVSMYGFLGYTIMQAILAIVFLIRDNNPELFYNILCVIRICMYLSIGIAALGFLVMFLSSARILDFLSGAFVGLFALACLLGVGNFIYNYLYDTGSIIFTIYNLSKIPFFYFLLALRAKKISIFFSLLMIGSFIFCTFGYFSNPVWLLGNVVTAGICFLEIKNEPELQ